VAVSFDLFGTLVTVERSVEPTQAVANELTARSVTVPDDWGDAYAEPHFEIPEGTECSLVDHVAAALESRGVSVSPRVVRQAVLDAFEPTVETREGAQAAVTAASTRSPVAVCSNCSVPGLVERTLERSTIEPAQFNAVLSSVDYGWRKPTPAIFEATADALGCQVGDLVHVGDDPTTDGGIDALGGRFVSLEACSLPEVADRLEAGEL